MKRAFKLLAVVVLFAIVVIGTIGFILRDQLIDRRVQPAPTDGSGLVEGRRFTYAMRDGQLVVTFTDFIPRSDAAFVAAVAGLVQKIFGEGIDAASGRLVGREVAFQSATRTYLVLPVKQDSGEIHSLTIRHLPR